MPIDLSMLQSTLDYLILRSLSWGSMHGFAIARWLEQVSDELLNVEEGTLYPALHRLERRKLIKGEWRLTESNRRAKFYRITPAGERAMAAHADNWTDIVRAMNKVVRAAEKGT